MTADTVLRRPGARGRIGVVQPAPGVMIEHEWPGWLPADILFPVTRLPMPGVGRDDYAAMAAMGPAAARDLASAGVGVVAYACTVGSLSGGAAAEQTLIAAMAAAAGVPAISLADASIAALARLAIRRVVILTPYTAETDGWIADYIEARGLSIEAFVATPASIATIGDYPPDAIASFATMALATHPHADALWIPCTAIQTLGAIATIERKTGRPVVSGSQALLWRALALLGVSDPRLRGAGRLFEA